MRKLRIRKVKWFSQLVSGRVGILDAWLLLSATSHCPPSTCYAWCYMQGKTPSPPWSNSHYSGIGEHSKMHHNSTIRNTWNPVGHGLTSPEKLYRIKGSPSWPCMTCFHAGFPLWLLKNLLKHMVWLVRVEAVMRSWRSSSSVCLKLISSQWKTSFLMLFFLLNRSFCRSLSNSNNFLKNDKFQKNNFC